VSLVVIGTDTGVGKTVACAVILSRYGRLGPLAYWKPVATGSVEGRDTDVVRRLAGHRGAVLPEAYLFGPPLSPHAASRRTIDPEKILEALVAHALADPGRGMVIEGVGGLLVPLTRSGYLLADLVRNMLLPCVLVARSRLGTINHTLLTLEALRARGIRLAAVILSGERNPGNRAAILRFGKVPAILELPPLVRTRKGVEAAARRFDPANRLARYLGGESEAPS